MDLAVEQAAPPSNTRRWTGWVMSGVVILFCTMDAGGKLIVPELMIANSPPLGLPAEAGFMRLLGAILAIATALYTWKRTSFLGAILLTAYFGGAVATHLRVGSPPATHTLFAVYLGLLAWGGLWLRDARIRALLPLA
jgi:hypothetical protein